MCFSRVEGFLPDVVLRARVGRVPRFDVSGHVRGYGGGVRAAMINLGMRKLAVQRLKDKGACDKPESSRFPPFYVCFIGVLT